jgi:hypothetical protein
MPLKFVKGTGLQSTSQLRLLTPLILFPQYPTLSPDYDPLLYAPPQFQDPQMKQTSFLLSTLASPISPMISLMCVLFFSFLATKSLGAVVDPRFLACSVPKGCGDGQNITFPFYIRQDTQEKYYCGHPGFQVFCNDKNGQPTLIMGDINYTIHTIFYQNQTLRVSNAAFFNSNTDCIPLIKDIPSSLLRFELVPKQINLNLLYNCSNSSLLHSDLQSFAGCDGENVVALSEDDPKLGNVSKECTTRVVAPVEAYEGESDGIRGALENGFWLKWKAANCSRCENSGGFCGFMYDDDNINYRSQCFCADRPHSFSCINPGQFFLSLSKLIFLFLSLRNLISNLLAAACPLN